MGGVDCLQRLAAAEICWRRYGSRSVTSGLPQLSDVLRVGHHFANVHVDFDQYDIRMVGKYSTVAVSIVTIRELGRKRNDTR
jgi:hypothetical protein